MNVKFDFFFVCVCVCRELRSYVLCTYYGSCQCIVSSLALPTSSFRSPARQQVVKNWSRGRPGDEANR